MKDRQKERTTMEREFVIFFKKDASQDGFKVLKRIESAPENLSNFFKNKTPNFPRFFKILQNENPRGYGEFLHPLKKKNTKELPRFSKTLKKHKVPPRFFQK